MKRKIMVLVLLIVTIMSCLIYKNNTKAYNSYYPDPPRGEDVPDNMVWSTYFGMYYDSNKYEFDEKQKKLIDKSLKSDTSGNYVVIPDKKELWLAENKNTKDPIDMMVIKYINEKRNSPVDNVGKSYYLPEEDKALLVLTDSGVKSIPIMVKKIKNNHPYSGLFMIAVEQMTKIKSKQAVEVSEAGISNWINKLNDKIYAAPEIVEKCKLKLKQVNSLQMQEQIEDDLNSIGIFAIPYIMEQEDIEKEKLLDIINKSSKYEYTQEEILEIKDLIKQAKDILR